MSKGQTQRRSINSKNFSFLRYQNRWRPGFRRCWGYNTQRQCWDRLLAKQRLFSLFPFMYFWLHVGACCQRETRGLSPPDLAMPEVVNLLGITNTHVSEVSDSQKVDYLWESLTHMYLKLVMALWPSLILKVHCQVKLLWKWKSFLNISRGQLKIILHIQRNS